MQASPTRPGGRRAMARLAARPLALASATSIPSDCFPFPARRSLSNLAGSGTAAGWQIAPGRRHSPRAPRCPLPRRPVVRRAVPRCSKAPGTATVAGTSWRRPRDHRRASVVCSARATHREGAPSSSTASTGKWSLGYWPSRAKVTTSLRRAETDPRVKIQSMRGPSAWGP